MPSPKSAVRETVIYKTVVKGGVSSSSITTALGSQSANRVFASPNGSSGAMSVRALVSDDIPNLAASKITSGEFDIARIPTLPYAPVSHTHTLSQITDAGTIASQAANNVAITGGSLSGLTSLGVTGNTTLGDTNTDTTTIAGDLILSGAPGKIRPAVNSTTALQIAQADGTAFITYDTTNQRMAINTTAFTSAATRLQVAGRIDTSGPLIRVTNTAAVEMGADGTAGYFGTDNGFPLYLRVASSTRGLIDTSGNFLFGASSGTASARLHVIASSAGTNDTQSVLILGRNSSGTPAANFASRVEWQLKNAGGTNNRLAATLDVAWNTATALGEIPDVILSAYYANGTQREAIRIRGGSSTTLLSFFGGTPRAQPNLGAWAGLTTDQKLDALRDALAGASGLNLVTYS